MSKSAANSKADTAVKLVLIFFISLLSFSVGTYVGKQVSDSDSRRAALEADYSNTDTQMAAHDMEPVDEATAPISDEEVASLAEEFVQAEREVASEHTAPADHSAKMAAPTPDAEGYTHHTKMMHKEAAAKVSSAADRVSHDQAPAADPKKVRTPSNVLPTVATTAIGKYTVQVASFATEVEAKEQAAKLTGKGYSAFYVPATVNGKSWYRVSVGLFSDLKSATNYRTELLATQIVSSAIVQKIVK
ncbi:MAG: SPOR domain-containing protein [Bdellovibrionales bacterium]|nr:SPOR domain-containing protein [Bdellovibrionales bacterium]